MQTVSSLTATGAVAVQPGPSDGEVRVTATGTYTGLQGKIQGSLDGTTYVDLAAVRADTGALVTGTLDLSAANLAYHARIRGWPYVRFNCTQISSGTAVIDVRTGTTFDAPSTAAIAVSSLSQTITSASANALAVGPAGATNPVLNVNAATGSAATGLNITGAAAAGGLAVAVISSGTNEALTLNAKGSGTIAIGGVSTGSVLIGGNAKTVLPGTLTAGGLLTCALQIGTSGPLLYSGSGAPSISAAVKGSIYLRSDGSGVGDRLYVATDAAGAWAAVTTES